MEAENSNIIQEPFTRQTLGEKPKLDTFTVRLNEKERLQLNQAKRDLDIKGDSTAMKELAIIGHNVLQRTFGKQLLRLLFKKGRARLSDYESF